jgi:hypothetical protein
MRLQKVGMSGVSGGGAATWCAAWVIGESGIRAGGAVLDIYTFISTFSLTSLHFLSSTLLCQQCPSTFSLSSPFLFLFISLDPVCSFTPLRPHTLTLHFSLLFLSATFPFLGEAKTLLPPNT